MEKDAGKRHRLASCSATAKTKPPELNPAAPNGPSNPGNRAYTTHRGGGGARRADEARSGVRAKQHAECAGRALFRTAPKMFCRRRAAARGAVSKTAESCSVAACAHGHDVIATGARWEPTEGAAHRRQASRARARRCCQKKDGTRAPPFCSVNMPKPVASPATRHRVGHCCPAPALPLRVAPCATSPP